MESASAPPRALESADTDQAPFVAISKFVVQNGMADEVRVAFENRPHAVDSVAGFVRMEVLRPVDKPEEFWLLTWWRDEESFRVWHRSHHYRDAHAGIPKGLRLDPRATRITYFEHLCF